MDDLCREEIQIKLLNLLSRRKLKFTLLSSYKLGTKRWNVSSQQQTAKLISLKVHNMLCVYHIVWDSSWKRSLKATVIIAAPCLADACISIFLCVTSACGCLPAAFSGEWLMLCPADQIQLTGWIHMVNLPLASWPCHQAVPDEEPLPKPRNC